MRGRGEGAFESRSCRSGGASARRRRPRCRGRSAAGWRAITLPCLLARGSIRLVTTAADVEHRACRASACSTPHDHVSTSSSDSGIGLLAAMTRMDPMWKRTGRGALAHRQIVRCPLFPPGTSARSVSARDTLTAGGNHATQLPPGTYDARSGQSHRRVPAMVPARGHCRRRHRVLRAPLGHVTAPPRRRDGRAGDRHRRRHDAGRVGRLLRPESERRGGRHRRSRRRRPDERAGVRRRAASAGPSRAVLRGRLDGLLRHVGRGAQSQHDRHRACRAGAPERIRRRRLASVHAGPAPAAIGVDQHGARRGRRRGHHRGIGRRGRGGSLHDLGHERHRCVARQRRRGARDHVVLRGRRDRPVLPLLPAAESRDDARHRHGALPGRGRITGHPDAHAPAAEPHDDLRQRGRPGARPRVAGIDRHVGRADLRRTRDVPRRRRHARRRSGVGGIAAALDAVVLR